VPRVNKVEKARKAPGSCAKCGKKIQAGAPYRWWKFRYGGKRLRCMECPSPRPSELTNSDKLSRCYEAGESISDAIEAFRKDYEIENLRGAMEEAAGQIREVAEEYRESAANVESGMNGNRMPICDELEEKADNLESKADEIESAAGDLEEFDEDQARDDAQAEIEGEEFGDDGAKKERIDEAADEKKEEWAEEQVGKAEEFTDISPEG